MNVQQAPATLGDMKPMTEYGQATCLADAPACPAPVLCCECGVTMDPNPTGSCAACVRSRIDITGDLPKQVPLQFCRNCERYLQPPDTWLRCPLESRQLLQLCLARVRRLDQLQLVDAAFVWTEPHSRRLCVRVTVQREVAPGATLQQTLTIEYVVSNHMCPDCHRTEAKDYWKALVQLRTKTANKKTFYYLEQLILRQRMHEHTANIKAIHDGLDFMFLSEAQARKFLSFVEAAVPCRVQQSKKLISHDAHNNTYNYKFTLSVEIVPLCKDSVVCLPRRLAQQLGGISQVCVVVKVTNVITLADPCTGQLVELQAAQYWRTPFTALCEPRQLSVFSVMEVETPTNPHHHHQQQQQQGHRSKRRRCDRSSSASSAATGATQQTAAVATYCCTDLWLVRADQLGRDDVSAVHTRTHLPTARVHAGDRVLALQLSTANVNNSHLDTLAADRLPELVVVKRLYGDRASRRRRRRWKLKRLAGAKSDDHGGGARQQQLQVEDEEFDAFCDDLEEDAALRGHINVYRDSVGANSRLDLGSVAQDEDVDEDVPQVPLHEMLEELQLDDQQVPVTDGAGARAN